MKNNGVLQTARLDVADKERGTIWEVSVKFGAGVLLLSVSLKLLRVARSLTHTHTRIPKLHKITR